MAEDITPGRQVLRGIKVKAITAKDLVDFDGDCFDPYALLILTEALDYAIEVSGRRLNAMKKVFPESGLEKDSATSLALLEKIKDALYDIPKCPPATKKPIKAEPIAPAPVKEPEVIKPKEEKKVPAKKPPPEIEEEKPRQPRGVAERWQVPVEYGGKTYESPAVLAKIIEGERGGIKVNEDPAARNTVDAFTRTKCYKVFMNGEERTRKNPGSKSEGKFRVVRVSPDCVVPEQYRLPPLTEQIGAEIIRVVPVEKPKPTTVKAEKHDVVTDTQERKWIVIDASDPSFYVVAPAEGIKRKPIAKIGRATVVKVSKPGTVFERKATPEERYAAMTEEQQGMVEDITEALKKEGMTEAELAEARSFAIDRVARMVAKEPPTKS